MYGAQQQFGQNIGNTSSVGNAPPQQELVRVLGQTIWNLRELESRIQVLKQECGVLCTTLGIPPHVVGLTSPLGQFGSPGLGSSPFGQNLGSPTTQGFSGVNPLTQGYGTGIPNVGYGAPFGQTFGNPIPPGFGTGIPNVGYGAPFGQSFGAPIPPGFGPMTPGFNPLQQQGSWYY